MSGHHPIPEEQTGLDGCTKHDVNKVCAAFDSCLSQERGACEEVLAGGHLEVDDDHQDLVSNITGDQTSASATVRQFVLGQAAGPTMWVHINIARRRVAAVVDTGAQVTLMSKQLFKELGLKSNDSVQLKNAKVDSVIEDSIVASFGFQFGGKRYCSHVVAADIEDEFILGLDFLGAAGCKLDLMNGTL